METYLLKFSVCLAVFWLVYVLFLERQNMHKFKRFYLLGAIVFALVIPNLTITEYVEPVTSNFDTEPIYVPTDFIEITPIEEPSFFTLENTLWLIYGFVALLLALRFAINIIKMQQRISKNKNIHQRSFIYVLLHENITPHSYFKYIFFNKTRYESDNIPNEVLLHEETHAQQLHTLDIILLELLQIVFWFHPLIYILKHHVKLNHEFLADQAVLNQGSNAKTYQNILLQFSSNTHNHQLSSAINYSSIKKRFTVMKTQTSKTRIWLSTFLVLPVIALLFFSFAEHVEVEKEIENPQVSNSTISSQNINYFSQDQPIMVILINRNGELLVDDEIGTLKTIETKLKILAQSNGNYNGVLLRYDPTDASEKALKEVKNLIKKYDFNVIQEDASPTLPIMTVLINRNGELLVDNKLGSLKSIETKLKTLVKSYDNSKAVLVKYDLTDAAKKALNEVRSLIRKYDFKVTHMDASIDVPIPAPPKPVKSSHKGGPNIENHELHNIQQNKKTIKPVEIFIKKNKSILLNEKPVDFKDLAEAVIKINKHLTIEERRNYVNASILSESNENNDFVKKIQLELQKSDITNSSVRYLENLKKTGLIAKHVSPNAGLTVEQAKIEQEKRLEKYKNFKLPKESSWAIETEVTYVQDTKQKNGPIEINGATYYFLQENGKTTYYDRFGTVIDINKIPPPPPIATNATPEQKEKMQKAQDAYMNANPDKVGSVNTDNGEVIQVIEVPDDLKGSVAINGEIFYYTTSNGETTYFNRDGKVVKMDNLPPPPPTKSTNPSFLEFIEDMEKQGATFFLDGNKISVDKVKNIAKTNKGKGTEMTTLLDDSGKYIVKLSSPKENKTE